MLAQMHQPLSAHPTQPSESFTCSLILPAQIAQAFSTRVDMLPQAYLDEFVRLQVKKSTTCACMLREPVHYICFLLLGTPACCMHAMGTGSFT